MSEIPTNPVSDSVLADSSLGGATRAATTEQRPDNVGPYRILELLGEGGMGEVYKAERRQPIRQTVAVKIIKLGFNSREIVGRFESERQALAMMDHPGIARVLDAGTTITGRPYFVMDYVSGKPITMFCDEHKLPIDERLRLFGEACEAIFHAHTKAIIHRDIKPSNVLAYLQDGKPSVKVIDFGIAKALTSARLTDLTVNTASGQAIGTYDCMSPEQVDGSPDIDTRTDVYSLGVLLYELLTGAKPFDQSTNTGTSDAEMKRIIREVEPPRPSTRLTMLNATEASALAERRQARLDALARQLRGELEWIPLKAMRKDRARRYESPLQLKHDIENYLEGKPLLAGPETKSYRFRKFIKRNQRGVVASAAMLLIVIVGVVLYIHNIRAEQARTKLALVESEAHRVEAQKQATIATDSNRFLANILANAQPNNSLGAPVTVVQAMERAAAALDSGSQKVEPVTEAMIRYVVGTTLRSLGRLDDGLPQLQRARELDRQARAPGDPQTRVTLTDLGELLTEQGKFDQAEPVYREALAISQKYLPPDDPEVAMCLSHLGAMYRQQGKFDQAEPMLRQVIDIRRKKLPPNDPEIASALNNLAAMYWNQGRLADAEPLARESLKMRQATLPAGHPNIAQSLSNLATLLRDQHKYVEAEPLCREALAMRRKALPPNHPDIAVVLHSLAWILNAQGKLDEAEPIAREALEIRRKALPAGHPHIATTCDDLAWVLVRQGKLEEAEPLFREALQIRTEKFGATAPPTTQVAGRLANLLDQTNRKEEAAALRAKLAPSTRPVKTD